MQPYEKYKNSGIDWLGQIPEHWEVKKLKYVILGKLKYGANESGWEYDSNLPRYIRISDFGLEGKLSEDKKLSLPFEIANNYLLSDGDILFARSGATVGKSYQFKISLSTEKNYCFAGYLIKAQPDTSKILSDFLYAYTQSGVFASWKDFIFNKATIENIGADKYSELFIPLPPLSEQAAIAAYLDDKCGKIDRAIGLKTEQIEQLKTLRQVRIQQAVTRGLDADAPLKESGIDWIGQIPEHWEVKRLKYVLDEINIRTTTGSEELLSLSKYLGIIPKSSLEERAGGAESLIGYKKVYYNNIVINKMQAVNGLIGVAKIEGITSPDYSIYKCKIDNVDYIGKLLLLPFYLEQYKKVVTGVMEGFIRLYTDDLYRIEAILPPLSEQEAIVSYLSSETERIDRAIALQNEQIEYLKSYKQSLINEAVTGKFRTK
ncbi:type I restriction enzyme, S subunit [Flexibacter flexilis DSM 6793]|uniref:Type I restriction enzyme, S subunit n=1 Tax=Flexibacter flexilis DSM 6793 TaxID=927664 RepID=A0A1I1HYA3_9BACT|nr:restriction endonuclease subunit S [Flexibacter flexilis]SFC29139.1 type I restriction enzyme, S subunit [Flexibacter flexilis DSM 6793]